MSYSIGNQLVLRSDLSPVSRTERKDKFRIADHLYGTPAPKRVCRTNLGPKLALDMQVGSAIV
jgi:hypothetical protein